MTRSKSPAVAHARAAAPAFARTLLAALCILSLLTPVSAAPDVTRVTKVTKVTRGTRQRARAVKAQRARAAAAATPASQARARRAVAEAKRQQRQAARLAKPVLAPTSGMEHFEGEGNHGERERWFRFQREYPSGRVPANARRAAWESRPRGGIEDKGRGILAADSFRWEPVGPASTEPDIPAWGLTSGRINSIAIHPTDPRIMLVGAATGGIWRSTDAGTTFTPVSDSQVDLAVGSIAFARGNPQVVYAAMGDNDNGYLGTGLLKSTDGGLTWAQVARLVGSPGCADANSAGCLPALGRSTSVVVDPNNANRVHLAHYAFYDGGPNNSTFANGAYHSTDGGVNWTRTLRGLVREIVMHPTNPQILYAGVNRKDPSGSGPAGVWKSTDGGLTWNNVNANPFTGAAGTSAPADVRLAVTPAAPDSIYVFWGGSPAGGGATQLRVESSTDGGQNWTNRGAPGVDPGQFGYNSYIAVHPANPNVIYVGTRDVYKTVNGGATWASLTRNFHAPNFNYNPSNSSAHPDQQSFAFVPGAPETIFIGNDGGLDRSANGGASFESRNASFSLAQFVGIAAHPTDPGITYGGTQDNGNQRRMPGTNRWTEFMGGDGGRNVTVPTSPNVVFATYIRGYIWKFLGDGFWYQGQIGDTGGGPVVFGTGSVRDRVMFYPPFVGNLADGAIYFGTHRLWVSTNAATGTATWAAPGGEVDLTNGGTDTLSAIGVQRSGYSSSQTIYTGSAAGRVMASTDGGATWQDRTAGLPTRYVESITVDPANPAVAYLSVGGYGSGHVFKTVNHGQSWADISGTPGAGGLPNTPTSALLIDPANPSLIYAGTDVGVFRSTTSGVTWETFSAGMPPAVVTSFAVTADGKVQASTYGRGIYQLGETEAATLQFSFLNQTAPESDGGAYVVVRRSGNLSGAVSVRVRTADDNSFVRCDDTTTVPNRAFPRCDYSTTIETVTFGPGEAAKSVRVPLVDDVHVEPNETVGLTLSNPSAGAQLGPFNTTSLIITSSDAAGQPNPVDTHAFFVRQQYLDFLSREPDAGGFGAWLGVLNNCANAFNTNPASPSAGCDRNLVSSSFFRSAEFQLKGFYVFRFYALTHGRRPQYTEIIPDMRTVTGATEAEVYQKKAAFAADWVNSPAFQTPYGSLTNQGLVDALMSKYSLASIRTPDPAAPDGDARITLTRADLVARLNAAMLTRPQLVRAIVDSDEVSAAEFRRAFVAMQYFGYLRRDPEEPGFTNWVNYLNANPSDFYTMVNGFANSGEYRLRFGGQ